MDNISK